MKYSVPDQASQPGVCRIDGIVGTTTVADVTERFDKVVPVLELGFGVTWQYRSFRLSLGYEYTNWFGLSDLPDFVDDFHQGKLVRRLSDLSIDGLMLRGEWRY